MNDYTELRRRLAYVPMDGISIGPETMQLLIDSQEAIVTIINEREDLLEEIRDLARENQRLRGENNEL